VTLSIVHAVHFEPPPSGRARARPEMLRGQQFGRTPCTAIFKQLARRAGGLPIILSLFMEEMGTKCSAVRRKAAPTSLNRILLWQRGYACGLVS